MTTPDSKKRLRLLTEERRSRLLLDAVKDHAIYLLDADGHVASWNAGARRFKGYTAAEIIGEHFSRFYTEEDRARGLPALALRTAAEEGKFEAEGWRIRKDGSRFWTSVVIDPVLDEDGELIGFAKITRDIGDKKEAQQALLASEQRFRILVEGVRDCAIYMLDPGGHVANWNAGAQAIKGYAAREVIGRHFSMFYTPEDQAAGEPARALETALTEGKYEREALRIRKGGTPFWASVLIDPIHDDTGMLTGFAKITRDVTERRRAQEEVELAREALAQSQKMEAIGRLTGGVAHDFNNLLTVIRSSTDLLRRPGLAEHKRERYVAAIAETADRAAQLTGQLLAFARRQPLRPESFDVAERVRGMLPILETSVARPIVVETELRDDLGLAVADPHQFDTALLNIVINARDAMPEGGAIRIAARNVDRIPAVRRHAAAKGAFVAITIEDSGSGIGPEALARIFEPFFTTKDVDKGTGLGLSQVYGFAKQSGGEIAVASTLGEGSRFTLYLPRQTRVAGARVEVATSPPAPSTPPAEGRSVLLVEDNEAVGQLAHGIFEELGQSVTWATHADAAIRILEEQDGGFDLVFSDVVMPGRSGIELAREIRQRWPALPVILTSGYSHVLAEEGCHGFDLIRKPYSVEDVLRFLGGSVAAGEAARA